MIYLGILPACGLVIVRVSFLRPLEPLDRSIRRWALTFVALGLVGSGLGFALTGAYLADSVFGMFDPDMLGMLWQTPAADPILPRIGGLLLILAGCAAGGRGYWASIAGVFPAIWSFSGTGHAAMAEAVYVRPLLCVHLAAAAFWIGILLPLHRLASDPATHASAALVGRRFGQGAVISVPIQILAGAVLALEFSGSPARLFTTPYGLTVLAKVFLVAVLLALAAANKFRFVPGLERGDRNAADRLARSIRFECSVVLLILLATAILTSAMVPPD